VISVVVVDVVTIQLITVRIAMFHCQDETTQLLPLLLFVPLLLLSMLVKMVVMNSYYGEMV
jgi:hypothetical protein